jgi:hypothetical protein
VTDEPNFPHGASVVQPTTVNEQAATSAFLNWVSAVLDWGRTNAKRADESRLLLCK